MLNISLIVRRRSFRGFVLGARLLSPRAVCDGPFPSNEARTFLAPSVLRLESRSVSEPESGVAGVGGVRLESSSLAIEDEVDIVRFRLSLFCCCCSPVRADTDMLGGREKVTPCVRVEFSESLLGKGKDLLFGEFDTVWGVMAVVGFGVLIVGNFGLALTVEMDAMETLRRSRAGVIFSVLLRFSRTSEGRAGSGDGMDKGGRVRLRSRKVFCFCC